VVTDPSKQADESVPVITPEQAEVLMREGETAARAYRERVAQMWAVSIDTRQRRAR
jgi:hypothetical protein